MIDDTLGTPTDLSVLDDGKEHDLVFVLSMFIDGKSLNTFSHRPMVATAKVTKETFDATLEKCMEAVQGAFIEDSKLAKAIAFHAAMLCNSARDVEQMVKNMYTLARLSSMAIQYGQDALFSFGLLPEKAQAFVLQALSEAKWPTEEEYFRGAK